MQIDLGWREFKPEFGDGDITVELRPLRVSALLILEPALGSTQEPEEGSAFKRTLELQQATVEVFKDHVQNMTGLLDGETPVPIEAISDEGTLWALASEIVNELVKISRLGKDEAKN